MSQRIFDTWSSNFTTRVESDLRTKQASVFMHTYLNELWSINSHYHEFTEQFYEVAEKFEVTKEIVDQYNRFVMEYNVFAQNFRDTIIKPDQGQVSYPLPLLRMQNRYPHHILYNLF